MTPVEDIPGRTLSGPFAEVDLVFSGWADFDTKLAERLQTRPARLVLAVAEPYPEKGVPPGMLSKWFAEAQASGGKVETRQYCDAARGDLRSWFAKLFRPSATANTLYKKRTADRDPGAFSNDVLCHIAPIGHGHINLRGVMTFELGHNRSALLGLPMADGRGRPSLSGCKKLNIFINQCSMISRPHNILKSHNFLSVTFGAEITGRPSAA